MGSMLTHTVVGNVTYCIQYSAVCACTVYIQTGTVILSSFAALLSSRSPSRPSFTTGYEPRALTLSNIAITADPVRIKPYCRSIADRICDITGPASTDVGIPDSVSSLPTPYYLIC